MTKIEVEIPKEVEDIGKSLKKANPEVSRDEAIKAIANTEYARGWAKSMCSLGGRKPTPECVENLSEHLATEIYQKV